MSVFQFDFTNASRASPTQCPGIRYRSKTPQLRTCYQLRVPETVLYPLAAASK